MDDDPLAHLRGSIRTGEVPGHDGVRGWGICFGDMDDVDAWVHFDDHTDHPGWRMTGALLDDAVSTADVVGYLGPIQGEIALRHAQVMRERLAARGLDADALGTLDEDIALGEAALAVRIRDAQAAHIEEIARITGQVRLLEHDPGSVPECAPEAALSYMTAVVYADGDEWMVFDDDEDENPQVLRCDPARGWVSRYALDPADAWQGCAVAQACDAVGPRHSGDVIAHTVRAQDGLPPGVDERIAREVAAARQSAVVAMTQSLRAHAHQAQVLERMGRHFPSPDAPGIAR